MKKYFLILSCLALVGVNNSIGQTIPCKTCIDFALELKDNKLVGKSSNMELYTTIDLPTKFNPDSLTIRYLFSIIRNNNIGGKFIVPKVDSTKVNYLLLPYKDTNAVFMQTSTGLWPWVKMRIENNTLFFSCDIMYSPPASKVDLEIIDLCMEYLKDSSFWNQNDDRLCDDDKINKKWSLYCALQYASTEKMGYFNHRGAALEAARLVINELHPDNGYAHPLMNYNNDPETKFSDIVKVLSITRERLAAELKNKN